MSLIPVCLRCQPYSPDQKLKVMMSIKKHILLLILAIAGCVSVSADSLEDARVLVSEGDFWNARQKLDEAAKRNPKIASGALYNYLLGVCEFEDGEYGKARKLLEGAKAKGSGEAAMYLGRLAFLDYDFPRARDFYSDYKRYREKLRQPAGETIGELEAQLSSAEKALERVELITVIDSLAVPVDNFFKSYRLPHSAGRLLKPEEIPLKDHRSGAIVAFVNEGEDYMIWGEPDSVGNVRLVESQRLTDGSWTEPEATPDFLNKNGCADFPFMMPDGVTLYYASDGNDSMGGYDIFVVSRDPQTGEFLQPQNLGMPVNSPYDDYMLAIDEENGIGWWATDRNLLGDKITIYIFKVNDVRRNCNSDDERIFQLARLNNYRLTWGDTSEEEIDELRKTIESIDPEKVRKKADFYIPKGNGEYYKSLDELPNRRCRNAVNLYLKSSAALERNEEHLESLRRRFARTRADNVARQIQQAEKEIAQSRKEVIQLRSEIYRLLEKSREKTSGESK